MQATTWATPRTVTDAADLMAEGFTPEQVQRLEELRAVYPVIEMVENIEQLRRMVFLKWLHEHRTDLADSPHAEV